MEPNSQFAIQAARSLGRALGCWRRSRRELQVALKAIAGIFVVLVHVHIYIIYIPSFILRRRVRADVGGNENVRKESGERKSSSG